MFARFPLLLAALIPGFAAAAECDGGIFVASGDVDGAGAAAGKLLPGLTLGLAGIDPDEIDYDGTVEGIDPDEIDYDGTVEGIDPDEIDYDGTVEGIDPDEIDYDGTVEGIDPDEIDYDGTVEGIDPDEIDYDGAACVQPGTDASGAALPGATIRLEGVALTGIDPDEIDVAWADRVLAATGAAQTREHILLARQVGAPRAALVATTGYAVLRLDDVEVREELLSKRPYATRAVADLTLTVVELVSEDPALEPVELWIEGGTTLEAAR